MSGLTAATGALTAAVAAVVLQNSSLGEPPGPQGVTSPFDGKRAAISLSFDDARASQLDVGIPLFEEFGHVHVTFYLTAENVPTRAAEWRRAAAAGHELGNHTMVHPCTGNFPWARSHPLEKYTLDRFRDELIEANRAIEQATGTKPQTFAYPCGQKFVSRGRETRSVVPIVDELFIAGRGWLDEAPNDPSFVDLAQVLAHSMDDVDFNALKPVLDDAIERGQWLVLAGHDIGMSTGRQITRVSMLREMLEYLREPSRSVWVGTVAQVARNVRAAQSSIAARPVVR